MRVRFQLNWMENIFEEMRARTHKHTRISIMQSTISTTVYLLFFSSLFISISIAFSADSVIEIHRVIVVFNCFSFNAEKNTECDAIDSNKSIRFSFFFFFIYWICVYLVFVSCIPAVFNGKMCANEMECCHSFSFNTLPELGAFSPSAIIIIILHSHFWAALNSIIIACLLLTLSIVSHFLLTFSINDDGLMNVRALFFRMLKCCRKEKLRRWKNMLSICRGADKEKHSILK